MTSVIAKYISKRVLGESVANNFGKEDPYFESVPATRLGGRPSKKMKKRRKALPPGLSEHDAKILTKVKRRAYHLDMSLFNCCGIRFGWSSVIGLVPAIGDVIDAFMAMMVFRTCQQIEGGLPNDVKAKMLFNIVLDFGIGLVPFLGDIADALFRANTRNAVVLEKYLREKGRLALKAQGQSTPPFDPTDPDVFDQQIREELGPPPQYSSEPARNTNGRAGYPQQDRAPAQRAGGGWFGGRNKQADLEQGQQQSSRRLDNSNPIAHPQDAPRRPPGTLQKNRR